MTRSLALAVVVCALVFSGCSNGDSGIGEAGASELAGTVSAVRATAASDPSAARFHLSTLRQQVESLRRLGTLSDAAAERILASAAALEAVLPAPPAPPSTTTTTTTTTATTSEVPAPDPTPATTPTTATAPPAGASQREQVRQDEGKGEKEKGEKEKGEKEKDEKGKEEKDERKEEKEEEKDED